MYKCLVASHVYQCVTSYVWMHHVTCTNASCHTYGWLTSHLWIYYVTLKKWVMSQVCMSSVLHCSLLQCVAVCCSVVPAKGHSVLQCGAVCCSVLQCFAYKGTCHVHAAWGVLQCICSVLQRCLRGGTPRACSFRVSQLPIHEAHTGMDLDPNASFVKALHRVRAAQWVVSRIAMTRSWCDVCHMRVLPCVACESAPRCGIWECSKVCVLYTSKLLKPHLSMSPCYAWEWVSIHMYVYMYIYIYIFMHIYIYIYMYVCIQIYLHTYIYRYENICICMYIYMYIYIYIYTHTHTHAYIYECVYIHIYVYICMYKYTNIHTYTRTVTPPIHKRHA